VRESLKAAAQIGADAVARIHEQAGTFSFIRPEWSLRDAES
jgi:hypothetical protein